MNFTCFINKINVWKTSVIFRCEGFQECCDLNAKSMNSMCETPDVIDCKTLECKWSNCTEMVTTQAPHTGNANAPISTYFTIGV
jgi:hypothetical protein